MKRDVQLAGVDRRDSGQDAPRESQDTVELFQLAQAGACKKHLRIDFPPINSKAYAPAPKAAERMPRPLFPSWRHVMGIGG